MNAINWISDKVYTVTMSSGNRKTGPIPVTRTSAHACPDSCGVKKNGCYADYHHTGRLWAKLTQGIATNATNLIALCKTIASFAKGQVWRLNEAGDLPGTNHGIDFESVKMLVKANIGRKGFTYTHKPPHYGNNAEIIKYANDNGFTINLSADNLKHADYLQSLDIGPVAVMVPEDTPNIKITEGGNKGVMCPATYRKDITCGGGYVAATKTMTKACELCQKQRSVIVMLPVHGTGKRKARDVANSQYWETLKEELGLEG